VVAGVAKADLLAPGACVGRYQLLRRLAIGGMAELHLACAKGVGGFQKVVVLKRVLPHLAADAGFVRMFLDEARLAAHLDHPNVVQVIDSGEAEGEYFYAMEYVHGRNVRELLGAASHAGGMPLAVALTICVGIASALEHAHGRVDLEGRPLDLVHRDVSPSNVLVSYDGAVKLTDFGIAKAATRTQETTAGTMKGKIGYMSPEQCRGEPVDRRSDIFSLGVVLFELTTCERLFFGDSDFAVLNKVVAGRFDPPSHRVPSYPRALERVVLRALELDREARYESAGTLRRELEAFAHDHGLRLGADTLAQWLQASFGAPAYPRVELRPPSGDDPLEAAATIVLVEDETTVARVREPQPIPPSMPTTDVTPTRSRTGIAAAMALGAAIVAVGAWTLANREPESPPTTSDVIDAPSVAVPAAAAATVARQPSAPTPAVTSERAPAPVVEPASAKSRPAKSPTRTSARRRERDRPAPSSNATTPTEKTRDLDALYPDKK
jgi:serine/threonine protein kinase